MSVPNVMAIHSIVIEIFHSNPQISTSWWHTRKVQGIIKDVTIHSVRTVNVCTKFYGNPRVVEIFQR